MLDRLYQLSIWILVAAGASACGAEEPSGGGEYYPMSVGNYWVYEETTAYGDTTRLRYEVTGHENLEFEYVDGARDVFIVENTWPDSGDLQRRVQFIEDDGTRAERLKHEIFDSLGDLTKIRYFEPGFLRFDRSKTGKDEEWTELLNHYSDLVDGTPIQEQELEYRYRVVDRHQEIAVPAGTFNCLVLERSEVKGTVGEVKIYYFAPGVGKVKEITENDKEEDLVEYHIVEDDDGV